LIWINVGNDQTPDNDARCQDCSRHMPSESSERSIFARNPLDMIAHAHAVQVQMCDAMERIADGLPDDVDRRLCAQVASCLQFDLPLHHHDEETGLFPILRLRALTEDGLDQILDRLAAEHSSDTDFASEIAESLELLGQGRRSTNPDMLGYMLRGFFERYRRHVHWENTLVMPLARNRLNAADLEALAARMESNRRQSG
jgi:hemerythrin-like domain-containing protein